MEFELAVEELEEITPKHPPITQWCASKPYKMCPVA